MDFSFSFLICPSFDSCHRRDSIQNHENFLIYINCMIILRITKTKYENKLSSEWRPTHDERLGANNTIVTHRTQANSEYVKYRNEIHGQLRQILKETRKQFWICFYQMVVEKWHSNNLIFLIPLSTRYCGKIANWNALKTNSLNFFSVNLQFTDNEFYLLYILFFKIGLKIFHLVFNLFETQTFSTWT